MQDRFSLYPGRWLAVPVAGQEGLFDVFRADEPITEGDPLNSATLLTPATAALLGVPEPQRAAFTPNDAFALLGNTAPVWDLLTEYITAGSRSWIAPDINGDGRDYTIGAHIIGAGGRGAAAYPPSATGATSGAGGGASGYARSLIMRVTPGQSYPVVVGATGAGPTPTAGGQQNGGNGGASSFAGNAALGGTGGFGWNVGSGSTLYYNRFSGVDGGQGTDVTNSAMSAEAPSRGKTTVDLWGNNANAAAYGGRSTPSMSLNPFDLKLRLGAGGNIWAVGATGTTYTIQLGATLDDGLKAGNGVSGTSTLADATSPGSGGGGRIGTTAGGAGAPGAVMIYTRKVGA